MVAQRAALTSLVDQTAAEALTALVLEVFKLNGRLLATGDTLVREFGLTSARWQVMGAVSRSPVPLPVAHIARNMGLTRQAVQRVADDLRDAGFIRYELNPHHRRAMLVALTENGAAAYQQTMERQAAWAQGVVAGLAPVALATTTALLRDLNDHLADPDNDSR
jgi:DNA-binding MarR family transcriptional regulator